MKKKLFFLAAFLIILTVAAGAPQALAHGTGASIEQMVGDYFIDMGYSPTQIRAGESMRFDFSLSNKTTNEEVPFTNVWLRINKDNRTVFAGGISRARFGLTGVTYTFGETSEYQISLRFENEKDAIVETTFPFTVQSSLENEQSNSLITPNNVIILLAGAVLGSLITIFQRRKKQ